MRKRYIGPRLVRVGSVVELTGMPQGPSPRVVNGNGKGDDLGVIQ